MVRASPQVFCWGSAPKYSYLSAFVAPQALPTMTLGWITPLAICRFYETDPKFLVAITGCGESSSLGTPSASASPKGNSDKDELFALQLLHPENGHRAIESLRLVETTKSSSLTVNPSPLCPSVAHLFKNTSREGGSTTYITFCISSYESSGVSKATQRPLPLAKGADAVEKALCIGSLCIHHPALSQSKRSGWILTWHHMDSRLDVHQRLP